VFANQVHAAGGDEDGGFGAKTLFVLGTESFGIQHGLSSN